MAEFGNHTIGSLSVNEGKEYIRGALHTCPFAGTANLIGCYIYNASGGDIPIVFGIYRASDQALVAYTNAVNALAGATAWVTAAIAWGGVLAATDYYLCFWPEAYLYFYYDGVGGTTADDLQDYGDPWPDPWAQAPWNTRKYSIYCEYTPTAIAGFPGNLHMVNAAVMR